MNAARFDRILRQVVLVPLLALLVGAGVLYWQIRTANLVVVDIQGADDRIQQTIYIEKLIVDEETGLRGYEVTHDPSFLEPFRVAEARLPAVLEGRLAEARTDQRRRDISRLITQYDAWHQGFALPIIATIQAGGQTGGQTDDFDLNLTGKREIDEMRDSLVSLNQYSETRRLGYIQAWQSKNRSLTLALIFTAILLGLVLGFYIRRLLREVSASFRQSHSVLRIRAEQAFRSEQRLRTTLQSIGDAVVTCAPGGQIESMNAVAEQLTGWSASEASGQLIEQVFHIVDETTREPVENPVAKVKRLNRIVGLANHTILIRKDGTELFIDDSGAPIRNKSGEITGVVLVFRDITIAKKSREALLANEKLAVAGRLAATIAHEIHNPLDSVSNLLFLMDGESTPEETAQFLALARQEITRVTQISRAMLSLYRESRAPVPIDLKDMLESILLLMERRFATLGVAVTYDLPEGLIVHGFPAELRQVFTNVLTNAAEAANAAAAQQRESQQKENQQKESQQRQDQPGALPEEPAAISITAEACQSHLTDDGVRREAGALISITDNGAGIPDSIRENLFKPFFTTKGERGTGLGLWVSRGIIGKHGGALDLISSTAPEDHGTTIEVYLATDPVIHPAGD